MAFIYADFLLMINTCMNKFQDIEEDELLIDALMRESRDAQLDLMEERQTCEQLDTPAIREQLKMEITKEIAESIGRKYGYRKQKCLDLALQSEWWKGYDSAEALRGVDVRETSNRVIAMLTE